MKPIARNLIVLSLLALSSLAAAPAPPYLVYLPLVTRNAIRIDGPALSFGYGWTIYHYSKLRVGGEYPPTSFNWIQITQNDAPEEYCGANRLPYHVLLRLNKAEAGVSAQAVADDAWTWAHNMQSDGGHCVDAFAIGNEPNLSGAGAYNGPIDALHYADQLCAAYDAIKATDPTFIVVTAGLAPTGEVFDLNFALDEEIYLKQMLDHLVDTRGRADDCYDVLGYHNYGFRAGYATPPDDPACPSGMCYRGVERIREILLGFGVYKRIWSTETGWLRDYRAECNPQNAPWVVFFQGFEVTEQQQSDQIVNAFQYARANWPWLGAIFPFNLDFNKRPYWESDHCYDEQGWLAVKDFPAEAALEAMPKWP